MSEGAMETYDQVQKTIPVPYVSRLTRPIAAGQTLIIKGQVNSNAKHFEVNLLTARSSTAHLQEMKGVPEQVPLHICFHFSGEDVISSFDSFLNGEWGYEEVHSNPFIVGKPFELAIRVHDDKYEVLTDNKQFASFNHRVSFKTVDYVLVKGDVSLSSCHWGGHYFTLPFETSFHGHSLESGQRVHIYGIPNNDFTIDLIGQHKDVLFHFNPRFSHSLTTSRIIRNACLNDKWGTEETEHGGFPLKKGEKFDLVILNNTIDLEVLINGEHYCRFYHRTTDPHKDYKQMRIEGGIELMGIEVSLSWETIGGVEPRCGKCMIK